MMQTFRGIKEQDLKNAAYVAVNHLHGVWTIVYHSTETTCSSLRGAEAFTELDAALCRKKGVPVVRFDKGSWKAAMRHAARGPMSATGVRKATGWSSFSYARYEHTLMLAERLGIPVEWNGLERFELPPEGEACLARLMEGLHDES